jgi:hypothetical protein|tara:strand:+ start:166 stop:348 length:183 start_codon:yes stop_codon:yes gene_type:complete
MRYIAHPQKSEPSDTVTSEDRFIIGVMRLCRGEETMSTILEIYATVNGVGVKYIPEFGAF